ncbi:hypothetical protein EDD18DRAFT_1141155 [Armillaria luteobubalina]|uniref:F-box domain-containing protein n=1 Tax=Armillaria luteobubalina TaxID=153913 RepID=A0AA39UXY4_9AGAR|nr:hypothetical protein EDD18DRAFT_1141155 [Armillaria luteobubalina]
MITVTSRTRSLDPNCIENLPSSNSDDDLTPWMTTSDSDEDEVVPSQATPSAINRLPPEVLMHIFSLMSWGTDYYDVLDVTQGPWVIGRVCGQWRDVIHSYPSVWASISILPPTIINRGSGSLLEAALRLSRPLKLSLHVNLQSNGPNERAIMNALVGECYRWKSAELTLGADIRTSFADMQGKFVSLERLDLYAGKHPGPNDPETINSILKCAPSLTDVRLPLVVNPETLELKWDQLTRLSTFPGQTRDYLDILRRADQLVDLDSLSYLSHTRAPGDEEEGRIIHTSLRSIRSNDLHLLDKLALPSLESLNFFFPSVIAYAKPLCDLLIRSQCQLRTLKLEIRNYFRGVHDICRVVPGLTELDIAIPNNVESETLFRGLIYLEEDENPLLPHLESLMVPINYTVINVADVVQTLINFVESRWYLKEGSPISRLRAITIRIQRPPGPSDAQLEKWKQLRREGLNVFISVQDNRIL